jgi:hypothetical protein
MNDDDPAREAAEHLQAAMRELIAAGHSLLGALEDMVERRENTPDLFSAFELVARRFIPSTIAGGSGPGGDEPGDGNDPDEGYEPIRVD